MIDKNNAVPPDVVERFGGQQTLDARILAEVRGSEGAKKPINERLQESVHKLVRRRLEPRGYQDKLFQQALNQNVIIYLGTGLGKTFVTVLLLNSPQIYSEIQGGRKVAFLAPTQDLTKQQAEYFFKTTAYKVRVYCGRTCQLGIHIDNWSKPTWQAELKNIDLLFMTPQIFAAAIMHNLIDWNDFSVVIFDEFHHACSKRGVASGHPYGRVLDHLNNLKRSRFGASFPRIIGLTASLVNNMPKDPSDIERGIIAMEKLADARCITDFQANETKPKMVIHRHNKSSINEENDTISRIFQSYAKEMDEALETAKAHKASLKATNKQTTDDKEALAFINRLKLASKGFSIKPSSFPKILRQMAALRNHCGLWITGNVCCKLIWALEKHSKSSCLREDMRPIYHHFAEILMKILSKIDSNIGVDKSQMLLFYSQPKVLTLLEILKREYDDIQEGSTDKSTFSCIVFVKSRIQVVSICNWLKMVSTSIAQYNFIKADYAIGLAATANSKWACITARKSMEQSVMLDNFRKGDLNVIVTTSVLEEGIDLPVCSTVIRYDQAGTFRVYVQSRGRARQTKSSYIAMCEDEAAGETELTLNKFNDFEDKVKKVLSDGGRLLSNQPVVKRTTDFSVAEKGDVFFPGNGEVKIDGVQAKVTLHMYAQQLIKRCPFSRGITGDTDELDNGQFITTLYMPSGCPFEQCKGLPRSSIELSEISAYVETVKKLIEVKEFDENGIPRRESVEQFNEILIEKNLEPDFNPLPPELEGQVVENGDKELISFDWMLYDINDRLSSGCQGRLYKLYKISFNGNPGEMRDETSRYFTKKVFGLIVGSDYTSECWQEKLFSHYGHFQVSYELLEDKLVIDSYMTHNKYSRYTYDLIKRIFGFNVRIEDFKDRSIFYLLALGHDNQIKLDTIRTDRQQLQVNDIVKINRYHVQRYERTEFFLVKAVRLDMNPNSAIPGERGRTFYESYTRNYGREPRPGYQPIIEVMPISSMSASSCQGKKIDASYRTRSRFYLDQVFDLVEYPAEIIFQSYNMQAIVFSIYLSATALKWRKEFVRQTIDKRSLGCQRSVPLADTLEQGSDMPPQDCDQDCDQDIVSDHWSEEDEDNDDGQDDLDDEENENDSDDDENSESGQDDNLNSSDSDSDEEFPSRNRIVDIHSRKIMQLNDSNYKMEEWDLEEYDVADLRRLTFEHRSSSKMENTLRQGALWDLDSETRPHQDLIIAKLKEIQRGILSDDKFMGDEGALSRAEFKVDLDVKPNLFFDRRSEQQVDRFILPDLVRALTQRRVDKFDNLESLENIGDSYLKYVISCVLFKKLENVNEGMLTQARSRLTSNKYFYHLAKKSKLGPLAIAEKFTPQILQGALGGPRPTKNTLRPKALADMLESLVGCCLIHGGQFEAILAIEWLGINLFQDLFQEFNEQCVRFCKPATALIDADDAQVLALYESSKCKVGTLQKLLNYKFQDPSFLIQAVTHSSSPSRCTQTYERLEFLGDSILDYLVTMTLYNSGINTPGQLTSSRSALVNNTTFAKLALKYRFHIFIEHASQTLHDELVKVSDQMDEDPAMEFINMVDFDPVVKLLGDIFESIAGAIYLDSGCSLDTVWRIYYPMMQELINLEIENPTKNELSLIYEKFPGKDRIKFNFFEVMNDGECRVGVRLTIDNTIEHLGEGISRRQAKLRVIKDFWSDLPSNSRIHEMNEMYNIQARKQQTSMNVRANTGRRRGGKQFSTHARRGSRRFNHD